MSKDHSSERQLQSYFFLPPSYIVFRENSLFIIAVYFGLAMRERQSCDGLSLSVCRKIDETERFRLDVPPRRGPTFFVAGNNNTRAGIVLGGGYLITDIQMSAAGRLSRPEPRFTRGW